MRIAILVFVAVFLLLGGGGAAWWFLLGPGADRTTDIFAAINKPDPVFVSVDPPLVISLIQQGEVTHHVTMQLNLLLADERNLDATNRRLPLLRYAILTELHSLFALRLVRDAGFESALVQQRMLAISDLELGVALSPHITLRG